MLVTCHYHYHLLKNIIVYIYIYITQLIGHLKSTSFWIHLFLTLGPNVDMFFYCAKKEMEDSTYLHVIQLEFHILLTISWWKQSIDFVKNKFHLYTFIWMRLLNGITCNYIELNFKLNFNPTKFNSNSIRNKSLLKLKSFFIKKFGQKILHMVFFSLVQFD
jgi:hypothetical protein